MGRGGGLTGRPADLFDSRAEEGGQRPRSLQQQAEQGGGRCCSWTEPIRCFQVRGLHAENLVISMLSGQTHQFHVLCQGPDSQDTLTEADLSLLRRRVMR